MTAGQREQRLLSQRQSAEGDLVFCPVAPARNCDVVLDPVRRARTVYDNFVEVLRAVVAYAVDGPVALLAGAIEVDVQPRRALLTISGLGSVRRAPGVLGR